MPKYKNLGADIKDNTYAMNVYICLEKSTDRRIFPLGRKTNPNRRAARCTGKNGDINYSFLRSFYWLS